MKPLLAFMWLGSAALVMAAFLDGIALGPSLAGAKMIGAAICGALAIITLGVAGGGWHALVMKAGGKGRKR